ncbi:MAG: MBL fold metallo-hydrolase [Bacteroidales bacterium]|nr:MBL fold metallo-hydrolase [Bacteroidales bacterium]
MKITILYDNTVFQKGLKPDWGFSCLVEANNRTILFDTGSDGDILLRNMRKLNILPSSIDDVFISHAHFDHIGGLSAFLNINSQVNVFVPVSFRGVRKAKKVVYIDKPAKLYEHIFSTGELENIEQSMAVMTDKGLVLVVGCSHPEMKNILGAASQFGKIYAIVGGLHGFCIYELFKDIEVICPTHCTRHIPELKALYPEKYIEGGVGKIINL